MLLDQAVFGEGLAGFTVHHSPEHSAVFVTWLLATPPHRPWESCSALGDGGVLGETESEPPIECLEWAGFVTVKLSSV